MIIMEAVKGRTQSRCREWERQRRNKFNEAVAKLGELVKTITKELNSQDKDAENSNPPKIEIIQKAIICLTQCAGERVQLKAEIMALQVKIDANDKLKLADKKEVSTQVYVGINRRGKNSKYMKKFMLKKSKVKGPKSEEKIEPVKNPVMKSNHHSPVISAIKKQSKTTLADTTKPAKLPTLLPKTTNILDKKGAENTIVLFPAAPYIFPQRQLILPTVPPTLVIVDPNMQPFSKPNVSIFHKNIKNCDITKTTMVNILPISAYSRPHSAIKSKRNNIKAKNEICKRVSKKSLKNSNCVVEQHEEVSKIGTDKETIQDKNVHEDSKNIKAESTLITPTKQVSISINSTQSVSTSSIVTTTSTNDIQATNNAAESNSKIGIDSLSQHTEVPATTCQSHTATKSSELLLEDKNTKASSTLQSNKNVNDEIIKELPPNIKNKENKLNTILDTGICESTVDGGNARLELAEELLASSPTAAFLMTFPLVSGNRADSPAEEQLNVKDNNSRRNEINDSSIYYNKANTHPDNKCKSTKSSSTGLTNKTEVPKFNENNLDSKQGDPKSSNVTATNPLNENPFLNLPMPSLITTNCNLADTGFSLDFDCNISKAITTTSTSYVNANSLFYKSDPFTSVKNTIYSTSSLSSGHEFNSIGLYPCAMEKYAKNKSELSTIDDNLIKIGPSRLTYDIDLGWSHKGFEFVNSATSAGAAFNKDNILTTSSVSYSGSHPGYTPLNPEFHVSITSSTHKKDVPKSSAIIPDTITSFYSQPSNLWSDEVPYYTNNNVSKSSSHKQQNFIHPEQTQMIKSNSSKQYDMKQVAVKSNEHLKTPNNPIALQPTEKYTKKSPNKMHINWMTSEIRPLHNNFNSNNTAKDIPKSSYTQLDLGPKKQDMNESNYFSLPTVHNFTTYGPQEEFQMWPPSRGLGTTEITIEPPPINLPTLVGDLALGPHDKKRTAEANKLPHSDVQNAANFLSVAQLMNRSTDHTSSRYHSLNPEPPKVAQDSQNVQYNNEPNRKTSRTESHILQPYYMPNNTKPTNNYENMGQFSQMKLKTKPDKASKSHKNSYSAESLLRGGVCTQKIQDTNSKAIMHSQKYSDYIAQDSDVAQVSHFPPVLDYSDNNYSSQQFSGTNLYNSSTNTITNSFYSNFMPSSSNLMHTNYASGTFSTEFVDYNQTDCNYSNQKYEDVKSKSANVYHQDKTVGNYKTSRKESSTSKHKLECSKKESSRKYHNKRSKLNTENEEWSDNSHFLWQNKGSNKRHGNFMGEELPFPNYMGNQMTGQYQADLFNNHLVPANMQTVSHNIDRSISNFPATSRANFNLSTIFPEIATKVQ